MKSATMACMQLTMRHSEAQLTYVQNGILAATLLNAGACDYVITGCGTGEGAMLALNSFPGVICGHVATPLDAYTFAQINDGNAISLPFALAVPEQRNKKILDQVKLVTYKTMEEILPALDQELVKGAFAGKNFKEYFFADATNESLKTVVKDIIG